jgi:hypothetical protein
MTVTISPRKVTTWRPGDLPAYLSNGLIGLRVRPCPLLPGVAMVSGFEGIDPTDAVETFAPVPYPLAGDLRVDGVSLTDAPYKIKLIEQRYDFATGELHTGFRFDPDGVAVNVRVLTLCSRSHPTVVLQETTVRPERDCELTLGAGIDPERVPGDWARRHLWARQQPAGLTAEHGAERSRLVLRERFSHAA